MKRNSENLGDLPKISHAAAAAKSLQLCSTLQPHRRGCRLLCPWDSPGKNTGLGCHFPPQCMHAYWVNSVMFNSVGPQGQQPTRLLCPQNSLGKNTGVGCHFLLQVWPKSNPLWLYSRSDKRFKGVDLIECPKNYGQRFITSYRRKWSEPLLRKKKMQGVRVGP